MAKTGDKGGQCVEYVRNTLKPSSGFRGDAWKLYNSTEYVTQLPNIRSQCVACWSGGPHGNGHVAVVELWDSTKKTMLYSDSNFNEDELVIVRENLTESAMLKLFGSSFKFQGYVAFK